MNPYFFNGKLGKHWETNKSHYFFEELEDHPAEKHENVPGGDTLNDLSFPRYPWNIPQTLNQVGIFHIK